MGRRKKEPRSVHRDAIACAASVLFAEKGIVSTSMDDIAHAAGYSKATLYVYFANKDDIVHYFMLDSMKKLEACIAAALEQPTTRAQYDGICRELVRYQEQYPFYFQMTLETINIAVEAADVSSEEQEAYQVGEAINERIRAFLCAGIARGDLRPNIPAIDLVPTAFAYWGMLAGVIQLAANKTAYMQSRMHLSKEQFLQRSFDLLYQLIENRGETP